MPFQTPSAIRRPAFPWDEIPVAENRPRLSAPDKAISPADGRPTPAAGPRCGPRDPRRGVDDDTAMAVRLLSIANTAILARLLTPTDFGMMAMASLALSVVAVFGVRGEDLALIRMGRPSREYLDLAWTLKIIISVILFICTLATAPIARLYFRSIYVELIVYLISLRVLLDGFMNMGTVYFVSTWILRKNSDISVYRKLCDVVLVLSCVSDDP